tara:strand:+ start:2859 stop:3977 length:1119 start_codon:yes stop_codon:yes gene_type:complete
VDTTKKITHLSLCSGYEGIGLGLRRIFPNLREIAYVEREGFVAANLVAKMEEGKLDAAPVHTDVKTFPYRKFRGKVSILSGGFPCQPFSAAGKRKATDDPRHLFPYIADGIRECEPRIVFLENVQGILSCKTGDGEPVLQYVLRTLEEMGYRATAGIFSAEEVGAPHQRKRVFILGMADSECSRMRRGRSSEECRDDSKRIQSNERERNELRSEAQRCSDSSREELGNASDIRPREHSSYSRETGTDQSREERRVYESQGAGSLSRHGSQSQDSQELANHSGERAEAGLSGQDERQERKSEEPYYCSYGWPSRPGEPQYEWEEPRVTGQTKPQLGGATYGYNSRVDRLRLLGNGVVPATATKAFVTLIQRVI